MLSFTSAENEFIITEDLGGKTTVLFPYDDEMATGWGTESQKIYYIDEETGEATLYDTELVTKTRKDSTERNYLKITTDHFSKFAIFDPKQTL